VWVLAAAALLATVAWAGTLVGVAVVARHRAETAADLAALAGAADVGYGDPCARATGAASRNRAVLIRCNVGVDGDVTVVVAVPAPRVLARWGGGSAVAVARAGR